jgi:hypothetical protein
MAHSSKTIVVYPDALPDFRGKRMLLLSYRKVSARRKLRYSCNTLDRSARPPMRSTNGTIAF